MKILLNVLPGAWLGFSMTIAHVSILTWQWWVITIPLITFFNLREQFILNRFI